MIEEKDLRPIKALSEIQTDIYFYKKESDGIFRMCIVHESEHELSPVYYTTLTKHYFNKGLLYIRINNPGHNFVFG